jgi:trigger factor
MQVVVENTGKLERKIQVAIPAAAVDEAINARLKSLSRTANLKGFRPGKAPINVIRQQFGAQVQREVIGDLLQSSFSEAVTQNQLAPAGSPRIEPQSLAVGSDLKYTATFEVFPEVELEPLDALEIERTNAQVTPEDVDAMIERLRKQRPTFTPVDRAAETGDRVTVDFEGKIGGEPFAGGKGEGVAITLGEGRMLAEFEQGLLGAQIGETRHVAVKFPEDYRATELAGKQAEFAIHVSKVESAALPELNAEFFASLGVTEGGLDKLREDVTANMRRELEQNLRARVKQSVLEKIHDANRLEVPNALVEAQVRDLQVEAMRRMGITDATKAPPAEPFQEQARRRVALGLLLNEIVRKQKIQVDQSRVSARLEELSASHGDPEGLRRAYRQNADAMRQIENLVLEDQVVDEVLAQAKVHEVSSNFKQIMQIET